MATDMPAIDIPKKEPFRRAWIKYHLALNNSSFAAIARELGIDKNTVQSAMHRPYPKMERAIAAKIGVEPKKIWPERYAA